MKSILIAMLLFVCVSCIQAPTPTATPEPTLTPTPTPAYVVESPQCSRNSWRDCWARNGGPWTDIPGATTQTDFTFTYPERGHWIWKTRYGESLFLFHHAPSNMAQQPTHTAHGSRSYSAPTPRPSVRTYTCGPEYNDRCWGAAYPASVGAEAARHGRYSRSGNWVTYQWTRSNGEVVRVREWAPLN